MTLPTFQFQDKGKDMMAVVAIRGVTPPKLESGNAKWEVVDRPKRRGATQYVGTDPYRVTVSLMFDFWSESGHGIWSDVATMNEQMFALENLRREKGFRPPIVHVKGALPVRGVNDWVIENLIWGDNVIWERFSAGNIVKEYRLRQDVTVTLLEHIDVQLVTISSKNPGNTRGGQNGTPKHKTHTVKMRGTKPETLAQIAIDEYGDRKFWKKIAAAQKPPIRDPNHLKRGQVLILP